MKKFFAFIAAAFVMATVVSCSNGAATDKDTVNDTVEVVNDSAAVDTVNADTTNVAVPDSL